MNTKEMIREQISALMDSELADPKLNVALSSLRDLDAKADWEVYHRIGDVLRSDDMAFDLSPGFAAGLAARLDAEPSLLAPATATRDVRGSAMGESGLSGAKRWALPGVAAAAAMATVAFLTTPQLLVAMKGDSTGAAASPALMTASTGAMSPGTKPEQVGNGVLVSATAPDGVILRDARIDDYLLAHQRFSPSVYSTAQYARSATFPTDSNK